MAWQLGTNSKRILPRLNGQLTGICPLLNDAALFLVSQRDNTTRIINLASMKVTPPPLCGGETSFFAALPFARDLAVAGSAIALIFGISGRF